ncbi:hypothetical protein [Moraxella lacunata]
MARIRAWVIIATSVGDQNFNESNFGKTAIPSEHPIIVATPNQSLSCHV